VVSCLVRATRCLSALENNLNTLQDLPASLLCTRVQVRSRAWDRSNFALQGALRGSSKECQIAKWSPDSVCVVCCGAAMLQ